MYLSANCKLHVFFLKMFPVKEPIIIILFAKNLQTFENDLR